jgi:hypothetical protein
MVLALLVTLAHTHRAILLRRVFFLLGLMYFYRAITMQVCTMNHAPCTMHHALCTMHHAPPFDPADSSAETGPSVELPQGQRDSQPRGRRWARHGGGRTSGNTYLTTLYILSGRSCRAKIKRSKPSNFKYLCGLSRLRLGAGSRWGSSSSCAATTSSPATPWSSPSRTSSSESVRPCPALHCTALPTAQTPRRVPSHCSGSPWRSPAPASSCCS